MSKKNPLITMNEVGVIALILVAIGAAYVIHTKIPYEAIDESLCPPCP